MKATYWQKVEHEFHKPSQIHLEALSRLSPKPGEKVLDLACGSGAYCSPILKTTAIYIGLDISKLSVTSLYERKFKGVTNSSWALMVGSAESIPLRDNSIDKVFCVGSFSYFPDKTKAIKEVRRVLKEDGIFAANIVNILDWKWLITFLKSRTSPAILVPLRILGGHSALLKRLFNHILKRDISKVELCPVYPKFTFFIKRFIGNSGFTIISLYYSLRNRKGPNYSREKVNLFRIVFCEGVILILQKTIRESQCSD